MVINPFSNPIARATTIAKAMDGATPMASVSMHQMKATPTKAKTEPTDRSTSPEVINTACPMAIIPTAAVTRRTLGIELSH